MGAPKQSITHLDPTLVSIEERQLLYAAMLLYWEALHGIDFFNPAQDPVGNEEAGIPLVNHLVKHTQGALDNVVEKLARVGITLHSKVNDQTTEIKTTHDFRDVSRSFTDGLPNSGTVLVCLGSPLLPHPKHCVPLSSIVPNFKSQGSTADPLNNRP